MNTPNNFKCKEEFNGQIYLALVRGCRAVFNQCFTGAPGSYNISDLARIEKKECQLFTRRYYLNFENDDNITYFETGGACSCWFLDDKGKNYKRGADPECFIISVGSFRCVVPVNLVFAFASRFEKLAGVSSSSKVVFNKEEKSADAVAVVTFELNKEIKALSKSVDHEELRPILNNVYLDFKEGFAVASDGHILSAVKTSFSVSGDLGGVSGANVPVSFIKKNAGVCSVSVPAGCDNNEILPVISCGAASVPCFPGRFPNWRSVLPLVSSSHSVSIAKDWQKTVKKMIPFAPEYSKMVQFAFNTGSNIVSLFTENIDFELKKEDTLQCCGACGFSWFVALKADTLQNVLPGCNNIYIGGWRRFPGSAPIFFAGPGRFSLVMPLNCDMPENFKITEFPDQEKDCLNIFGVVSAAAVVETSPKQRKAVKTNENGAVSVPAADPVAAAPAVSVSGVPSWVVPGARFSAGGSVFVVTSVNEKFIIYDDLRGVSYPVYLNTDLDAVKTWVHLEKKQYLSPVVSVSRKNLPVLAVDVSPVDVGAVVGAAAAVSDACQEITARARVSSLVNELAGLLASSGVVLSAADLEKLGAVPAGAVPDPVVVPADVAPVVAADPVAAQSVARPRVPGSRWACGQIITRGRFKRRGAGVRPFASVGGLLGDILAVCAVPAAVVAGVLSWVAGGFGGLVAGCIASRGSPGCCWWSLDASRGARGDPLPVARSDIVRAAAGSCLRPSFLAGVFLCLCPSGCLAGVVVRRWYLQPFTGVFSRPGWWFLIHFAVAICWRGVLLWSHGVVSFVLAGVYILGGCFPGCWVSCQCAQNFGVFWLLFLVLAAVVLLLSWWLVVSSRWSWFLVAGSGCW